MMKAPPTATYIGRVEPYASNHRVAGQMKVGQLVDAFVLPNHHHGQVKLRIGNTTLTASTNINVPNNTHLQLQVIQLRPQLLLQLVPTTSEKAAVTVLQEAAAGLLPRQDGLAPSLAGLLQKAFTNSKSREHQHLRTLIDPLAKAIPERRSLSHAEGLRQTIMHSGIFLEALLSRMRKQKKTDTSKDIRACLLRLRHGLEQHKRLGSPADDKHAHVVPPLSNSVIPPTQKGVPTPQHSTPMDLTSDTGDTEELVPDIMTRTRSALSRLSLLQVYSAENFNQGEYIWQLELPVKHSNAIEIVSLSIEKEYQHSDDGKNTSWIVNLAVDLPMLGAVQIRVSVFEQGVSSCFRPASSSTARLIDTQFEQLRTSLEKRSVRVLNLSCQDGDIDMSLSESNQSTMDIVA